MTNKHNDKEIAKALQDMPRWRAKTSRAFLGYAILIAFMALLLVSQMWFFRDKIIDKFATKPIQTLFSIGATGAAVCMCVHVVYILFSVGRDMAKHNAQMAEWEAKRQVENR